MGTKVIGGLATLALLLSACASTPAPGTAAMRVAPQPCVEDQLQYPDPCAPASMAPVYYDDTPYSYGPSVSGGYFPGGGFALPPPLPVKPPTTAPGKPAPKPKKPAPKQPCPKGDKACP